MPTQFLLGLKCEGCRKEYGLLPQNICDFDFGPLRVHYDYAAIANAVSREKIKSRDPDMWRYIEFLPIDSDQKPETSLGAGCTPLIRAKNLARALGVEELYIKDDRANPTHSFKDRVVEVAVAKAIEFGYKKIGCASTGNLANSVAAYAARSGLKAYVVVPADLEREKIIGSAVFGPTVIGIKGAYDDVNRLCSEIADAHSDIAFVNINLRPYYGDGAKTMGYEIAEQLGWKAPGHVVVPMAGASLINKVQKAFTELYLTSLIDKPKTRAYGAQGDGSSPVVNAILDGSEHFTAIPRSQTNTIAKSLAIGNPADGNYALKTIRESRGYAANATDEEIIQGVDLLAQTEGIWTETAGGVVVASAKKLIKQGRLPRNDGDIIFVISGDGYKTPEATHSGGLTEVIGPKLTEFEEALKSLEGRVQQLSGANA